MINNLIKESLSLGLVLSSTEQLIENTSCITKIAENIFLDETLVMLARDSELPLPKKLYQKSSLETANINGILSEIFMEVLNQIKKIGETLEEIKNLIETAYGVSYNQMLQEPHFNFKQLQQKYELFREIFIQHFCKLLKEPPPRVFLENRITN